MQRVILVISIIAAFSIGAFASASAQESPARTAEGAAASTSATRIEVDEQAHVIRFFIEGEERGVLHADGLHINGDIDYSGTLQDGNRYSRPPADKRGAE